MRAVNYLRTVVICAALVQPLISCERGSSNTQTKEKAIQHNEASAQGWDAKQDATFLVEAYSYGIMLMQYSELALLKAQTPALKSFVEQSATWHKKLNDEIKQIAAQKEVELPEVPGDDVQRYMDKLSALPPAEFEPQYLKVISDIQRNMISQYETASDEAMDMNTRNWAAQTLPYMQAHAQAVEELKENIAQ